MPKIPAGKREPTAQAPGLSLPSMSFPASSPPIHATAMPVNGTMKKAARAICALRSVILLITRMSVIANTEEKISPFFPAQTILVNKSPLFSTQSTLFLNGYWPSPSST